MFRVISLGVLVAAFTVPANAQEAVYTAKIYCSVQGQMITHPLVCFDGGRVNIKKGISSRDLTQVDLASLSGDVIEVELPADFRVLVQNGPRAEGVSSIIEVYNRETGALVHESSAFGPYKRHGVED